VNLIHTLLRNDPLQTLREWALLEAYQLARREGLPMPSKVFEVAREPTPADEPAGFERWAAQVFFGPEKRIVPRVTVVSHDSAEGALLRLILDLRAGKIHREVPDAENPLLSADSAYRTQATQAYEKFTR
jgi:hypothetical protein